MQLTSVNFAGCDEIEGNINRSHESTQNNGLGHYESLMPQGNNLNVPRKFFAIPAGRVFESTTSPHFFSRTCKFQRIKCIVTTITPIPGDKEAFKKAHPSLDYPLAH